MYRFNQIKGLVGLFALGGVGASFAGLHVDQLGYPASETKYAMVSKAEEGTGSPESITLPTKLTLQKYPSGEKVVDLDVVLWSNGDVHSQSGNSGGYVDFSSVTTPGAYTIKDNTNDEESFVFEIRANPYVKALGAAFKYYYYQRSGFDKTAEFAGENWADTKAFVGPGQDLEARFINDTTNTALYKDIHGGWFDAGDYNKYITFAHGPVQDLLLSYRENPNVWNDKMGLPESGNGLPDLLDELKWEMDWVLRMQNTTTSKVHIKSGSIHHGSSTPPSTDKSISYYGPECTSATINFAAMTAHASTVYGKFNAWKSYSDSLILAGEAAWAAQKGQAFEENCDDGTIKAGDADNIASVQEDHRVVAAIYLWEATGKAEYHDYIKANYTKIAQLGWWGPYNLEGGDAALHYTTLTGADNTVSNYILNALNNSKNYAFFGDKYDDLFKVHMADAQYHWGSNKMQSNMGLINLQMVRFNTNLSDTMSYRIRALNSLNYLHGRNPLNYCYLTNFESLGAENSITEIFHSWYADGSDWDNRNSAKQGPPPGYLSGGPNGDFSVTTLTPPSGQPVQKAYLDFNDGYPLQSWEITEPSNTYQAAYLRLLANFVNQETDVITPVAKRDEALGNLELFNIRGQGVRAKLLNSKQILKSKVGGSYFK